MSVKTPNHECRTCHKMYYACNAALTAGNSWKSMCCSPECYQEYQRMVFESRKPKVAKKHVAHTKPAPKVEVGIDQTNLVDEASDFSI